MRITPNLVTLILPLDVEDQVRRHPRPITLIVTRNLTNNLIEHIYKLMTVGTITTKLRKLHIDRIKFGVLIVKTNSVTNPFDHLVNGERSTGHTNVLDLFQSGERVIHYGEQYRPTRPKVNSFDHFF